MSAPVATDVATEFSRIAEMWSPKTIAALNNHEIKLVKLQGEFEWHSHENDELFLVIDGVFRLQMRGHTVSVGAGQFIIVPGGVENCPTSDNEAHVLILEPIDARASE